MKDKTQGNNKSENQTVELERCQDQIESLKEENMLLKNYNNDLKERLTEIKDSNKELKSDYKTSDKALKALTTRKTIRIYRRGLRLIGKDVQT